MVECWPPTVEQIVLFIASLSIQSHSYRTAQLYISAIAFQCKIKFKYDTTKHYIISKLLEGIKRSGCAKRSRLPITFDLLTRVISVLKHVCSNSYEAVLFAAAFSLAFFGFFRVGELVVSRHNVVHRALAFDDLSFSSDRSSMFVRLRFSKTDQMGKGTIIKLQKSGGSLCPIIGMAEFLKVRPICIGPLFCHLTGKPLTRYQFSAVLKKALIALNVNFNLYKSHSFRIGAATTAASLNYSVETIKAAGRWSSEAYQTYIHSGTTTKTVPLLHKQMTLI